MSTLSRTPQKEVQLFAISFDLSTHALDANYSKSRSSAYQEIGSFLSEYGYEAKEGSVYHSTKPQTTYQFSQMMHKMDRSLPWLNNCLKNSHKTIIPEKDVDLKAVLDIIHEKNQSFHQKRQQQKQNPIKEAIKQMELSQEQQGYNPIKEALKQDNLRKEKVRNNPLLDR